jgi:hypothetical protein
MFEIPYGLKSDVGQRARLLLAPASPSYNNKKGSPIKKTSPYLHLPLKVR